MSRRTRRTRSPSSEAKAALATVRSDSTLVVQRVHGAPLARLKHEEIYRRTYVDGGEAKKAIADYLRYFNEKHPHQALDNRALNDVFYETSHLKHCPTFADHSSIYHTMNLTQGVQRFE